MRQLRAYVEHTRRQRRAEQHPNTNQILSSSSCLVDNGFGPLSAQAVPHENPQGFECIPVFIVFSVSDGVLPNLQRLDVQTQQHEQSIDECNAKLRGDMRY